MAPDKDSLIEEQIHQIKSYLSGELNPDELKAFETWLEASDNNRKLFDRINNHKLILENIHFAELNDKEKGWQKIQQKISRKPNLYHQILRYAAVIVIPLCIVYMIYDWNRGPQNKQAISETPTKEQLKTGEAIAYLELATGTNMILDSMTKITQTTIGGTISTQEQGTIVVDAVQADSIAKDSIKFNRLVVPKGGEYKIILADGTHVWVNSLSTLEFPTQFTGKERRIRLTGEAYFNVAPNSAHPFIIECGDKELKVLGTTFNINDYNGKFVTTLETGKVAIKIGHETYCLKPSMQLCAENDQIILQEVNTKEFTAWKDGLFVFKKQQLKDVLEILSRWYNIEIIYKKEELKHLHFTGTIERYSDITEVLKFLAKTNMVNFTINGHILIVG